MRIRFSVSSARSPSFAGSTASLRRQGSTCPAPTSPIMTTKGRKRDALGQYRKIPFQRFPPRARTQASGVDKRHTRRTLLKSRGRSSGDGGDPRRQAQASRKSAPRELWIDLASCDDARHVAEELDKQAKSIRLTAKYDALPLEEKQIVSAEVDRLLREQAQSETSDFPVNLPGLGLGQPVLKLAIENDDG